MATFAYQIKTPSKNINRPMSAGFQAAITSACCIRITFGFFQSSESSQQTAARAEYVTTNTYGTHDQLLTSGSKSYGYDSNGNCTSVTVGTSVTSISYDYENRVTGITYPSSATNSFSYNGNDMRMQKVDSAGTANYLCDGTTPASAVLKDGAAVYTPGLSERRGTTSKFYHGDALGSTRGITNSSQAVTDSVLYDGFGMTVSRTGTTPTPFGFVGKGQYQTDSDSGLMLLGHRYYDASVGRFISSDPAKAGDNWYAYCDNNPLQKTDAQGLSAAVIGGIIGGGAALIGVAIIVLVYYVVVAPLIKQGLERINEKIAEETIPNPVPAPQPEPRPQPTGRTMLPPTNSDQPITIGGANPPPWRPIQSGQMGPPSVAGPHLPHGTLWTTSVEAIVAAGGTVTPNPEPYRTNNPGVINDGHVDIGMPPNVPIPITGGPFPNVPKDKRIPYRIDEGTYP